MGRKKKAFTRDERKVQIVTWFASRIQNGNENYATMNEIARGLDMSPSTHLANILLEMVCDGSITDQPHIKSGRWAGNKYMLTYGTYQAPKRRAIPLKVRGALVGQMELFK